MSVERVVANNLRIAHEDLKGARLLAKAGNRNAAYLCEQAAEKIIRAVLTSEGIHAGIGHALSQMVETLPDANPLKPGLEKLTPLAAFATAYRYPTSSRVPPAPGADVLAQHLDQVEAMLLASAKSFEVDLTDPTAPSKAPRPPR